VEGTGKGTYHETSRVFHAYLVSTLGPTMAGPEEIFKTRVPSWVENVIFGSFFGNGV